MATFYNSATLSYNGNVLNSNVITGELLEALSATKTAVLGSYSSGDTVSYVISIINTNTTDYTGLTVTDDLGSYSFSSRTLVPLSYVAGSVLYYSNGVLQATPTVAAGPPLVISGISVPAGGNVTIVYDAAVNQYAPLNVGATVDNTVTISGGTLTTPITADETITVAAAPVLSISKALSPAVVTENSTLTYTFTIQNSGNTAATVNDSIVLTDTFNPILNPITVTFNGTTWAPNVNYTYNPATGVFTTLSGQITVPAASYAQNPASGAWTITPGISTLVVSGTV